MAAAAEGCRSILSADEHHPDALHLLGVIHLQVNELDTAEQLLLRSLARREDPKVFAHLGLVLRRSLRLDKAEAAYRRAIDLAPDQVGAVYNLGNILQAVGKVEAAKAAFRQVIEREPNFVEAHNNLGLLLLDTGRLGEAEEVLGRALQLRPDYAIAYHNLGLVLQQGRRYVEAEAAYDRALSLSPDFADVYNSLGYMLQKTKNYVRSEAAFRRAIEIKPDLPGVHYNLGNLLREAEMFAQAESAFRTAIEIKPDDVGARLNLGHLLLLMGRYDEAWPFYEARNVKQATAEFNERPDLPFPSWRGEPLVGKTMVIVPEQGFGDYIQFVRYASALKDLGLDRLTLVCDPALQRLLAAVSGVDAAETDLRSLAVHDFWSFPLSLPYWIGAPFTFVPAAFPYLRISRQLIASWQDRLPKDGFKVGLVWKGSADHRNDANRSLPHLVTLAKLWSVPGVQFVSLQRGQAENDLWRHHPELPLLHLGSDIQDFADAAAVVAQLDLVICVDTAIAHLAGALGKPCWVLLPRISTDWRWLRQRSDSPWYPGVMRLFRQSDAGNWEPTVEAVTAALKDIVLMQQPKGHWARGSLG